MFDFIMGKKEKNLNKFFEDYLGKKSLFKNKKVLQSNYLPKNIFYRDKEIDKLAKILRPSLKLEKPSNIFLYGKTGTGKTLTVKYVRNNLIKFSEEKNIPLKVFYLNCKLKRVADTGYRLIAQLARDLGANVPVTGLPTDEVYKLFIDALDKEKILLLIVLDEIDQLVNKTGDEVLYNLTRLNPELKNSEISIIGISNDLIFADNLDPRVKSSLSEEELVFPPYDALQLQKILKERAKITFENGVIGNGVIEKCSAYAAREHGDARRALELLRVAGEIAERNDDKKITIKHVDLAEEKIEKDRILDMIMTLPKQGKLTLFSIFNICFNSSKSVFTGEIYDNYKNLAFKCSVRPLTQRRLSDIIAELDMLGIINAKVISKGRYGRTREICLAIPDSMVPRLNKKIKEELSL